MKRCIGRFKVDYVFNDYHSRATNSGVNYYNIYTFFSLQEMDLEVFIHLDQYSFYKYLNIQN